MTEPGNRPSQGDSRTDRRNAERGQLDYATWRDRLAAPGSRFERDRRTPPPAVRIDAVARRTDAVVPERLAA